MVSSKNRNSLYVLLCAGFVSLYLLPSYRRLVRPYMMDDNNDGEINSSSSSRNSSSKLPLPYMGDNNSTNDVEINSSSSSSSSSSSNSKLPLNNSNNDEAGTNRSSSSSSKLSLPLPLKPPFYIYQMGPTRSGSTFQTTLLDIIVTLKTQQYYDALGESPPKISVTMKQPRKNKKGKKQIGPFIVKTHIFNGRDQELVNEERKELTKQFNITTHVFTSSQSNNWIQNNTSLHHQALSNMHKCSLCEIDSYVPIFGMTQEDVQLVKDYMSYYEIIRQCCGLQQSKYNRYRLHGCNVTQLLMDEPDIPYPYCERHDLPTLEKEFDGLPLKKHAMVHGWEKPGDCAKFEEKIIAGIDFNRVKFVSCAETLERDAKVREERSDPDFLSVRYNETQRKNGK